MSESGGGPLVNWNLIVQIIVGLVVLFGMLLGAYHLIRDKVAIAGSTMLAFSKSMDEVKRGQESIEAELKQHGQNNVKYEVTISALNKNLSEIKMDQDLLDSKIDNHIKDNDIFAEEQNNKMHAIDLKLEKLCIQMENLSNMMGLGSGKYVYNGPDLYDPGKE